MITSDSEYHLTAIKDLLGDQGACAATFAEDLRLGQAEEAGGNTYRQIVTLRKGIADDLARKINKQIREQFPKASRRSRATPCASRPRAKTNLQAVIKFLRDHEADWPVPLQFTNYR